MKTIAIAGTFDTKGHEFLYVKDLIEELGLKAFTIHSGVFEPIFEPDVSNAEVAAAAGYDIKAIAEKQDRALGTEALSKGMEALLPKLYAEGKFDGILSLGGSGGTSLATPAMRALPIGVPKLMVSTMASGNVSQYVGTSDIIMMPSIVDVAGLNKISKTIFRNAVLAMAGMVGMKADLKPDTAEAKPLVAATSEMPIAQVSRTPAVDGPDPLIPGSLSIPRGRSLNALQLLPQLKLVYQVELHVN